MFGKIKQDALISTFKFKQDFLARFGKIEQE
jgi:hypothetical protein